MLYAGIDEAGYGPMLGPLCVAATVFHVEGHEAEDGAPNLWSRLRSVVCRGKRDKRQRIAVDDSKRLKGAASGATHPLRHLERGVLAHVAAHRAARDAGSADHGGLPETDTALFAALGADVAAHAWLDSESPLPVAQGRDELRIVASRLRRGLERAGVRCELVACEAIDPEVFNRRVERMGTKAGVNLGAVLRHVERIWSRWPERDPRVVVDRQGGRTHYREDLQLAFPEAALRIVAESERVSRYVLKQDGSRLTISFSPCSEDRHLPVALASMTAKYVRELQMLRLNRFFQGHLPQLKPTAGYVEDGRRYLGEIRDLVRDLGLERPKLVRSI